jgi:hypothetical protein
LKGLKENIIVGRLIPAGTGLMAAKYRKIANQEKRIEDAARESELAASASEEVSEDAAT